MLSLNSNIAALNARNASLANFKSLNSSLQKLSTGLRINSASDDSAGLFIADSLRTQGNALSQAVKNANDGIAVMQIADNAMDEQIKIIDQIKSKATQAAQDGQSEVSRKAIQRDILKLLEELDNIATTTSFNSQQLLSGTFINKEFQIGAYSNQVVKASIDPTTSNKIGHVRYETGKNITQEGMVDIKLFEGVNSDDSISLHNILVSHKPNTGVGKVAEEINKFGQGLQLRASYSVRSTGTKAIEAGDIQGLKINEVEIGNVTGITTGDNDGKLVAAINARSDLTGVEAFVDRRGHLNLKSLDGRGIVISSTSIANGEADIGLTKDINGNLNDVNYGRLTLTRLDARDIIIKATKSGSNGQEDGMALIGMQNEIAESTVNLKDSLIRLTKDQASALGIFDNAYVTEMSSPIQAGVLSTENALNVMNIADSALSHLNRIRSNIGSTQQQLERVIDNLSITTVNIKSAESQIRDTDFADETKEFQKYQILAQAGNYALSQANITNNLILKLLQ